MSQARVTPWETRPPAPSWAPAQDWGVLHWAISDDGAPTRLEGRLLLQYATPFFAPRTIDALMAMWSRTDAKTGNLTSPVQPIADQLGCTKDNFHKLKRPAIRVGVLRVLEICVGGFNLPSTYTFCWNALRAAYRAHLQGALELPRRVALRVTELTIALGAKLLELVAGAKQPPEPPAPPPHGTDVRPDQDERERNARHKREDAALLPSSGGVVHPPVPHVDPLLLERVTRMVEEHMNPEFWAAYETDPQPLVANIRANLDEEYKKRRYAGARKNRQIRLVVDYLHRRR